MAEFKYPLVDDNTLPPEDKLWHEVKDIFIAAMKQGLAPREAVQIIKALGYTIARVPRTDIKIELNDGK